MGQANKRKLIRKEIRRDLQSRADQFGFENFINKKPRFMPKWFFAMCMKVVIKNQ
jgi:hypothetical protein